MTRKERWVKIATEKESQRGVGGSGKRSLSHSSYYSGELEPHKMELCTRSMKGAEQIDSLIVLVSQPSRDLVLLAHLCNGRQVLASGVGGQG